MTVAHTNQFVEGLTTGRGAAVTYGTSHVVTAVGISADGEWVAICDNKSPRRILKTWKNHSKKN